MSEDMQDEVIHFWNEVSLLSPCGVDVLRTPYTYGSPSWPEVTCGECKLERPYEKPAEYKIPANVTASDKFTGAETFLADTLPRAAVLHKRLADAREFERVAEMTLASARRMREAVESDLSALLPGGQAPGVPEARAEAPEAAEALSAVPELSREAREMLAESDGFVVTPKIVVDELADAGLVARRSGRISLAGQHVQALLRNAPVSAVDIRTEGEYAEGMKLSDNAKSALINSSARRGMVAIVGKTTNQELRDAGLLGPNRGLTRAGEIARDRLMREREDQAFG